ncbi:hypothetical protein HYV82_04925 [Candidatus Woesearchaeota archaeon]|nr:hypothetical protein [Candidatus Woesearchaeota archaeon]
MGRVSGVAKVVGKACIAGFVALGIYTIVNEHFHLRQMPEYHYSGSIRYPNPDPVYQEALEIVAALLAEKEGEPELAGLVDELVDAAYGIPPLSYGAVIREDVEFYEEGVMPFFHAVSLVIRNPYNQLQLRQLIMYDSDGDGLPDVMLAIDIGGKITGGDFPALVNVRGRFHPAEEYGRRLEAILDAKERRNSEKLLEKYRNSPA